MDSRTGQHPVIRVLIELLTDKQEILQDLLLCAEKQKDVLQEANETDMELLNSLLEERETLMQHSDQLDVSFLREMETLKKEMGVQVVDQVPAGTFPPGQTQALQDAVAQTEELLQAVFQVDTENRKTMKDKMDQLKSSISQVQQGKKAIHSYANTKQHQPSLFMDKKEKNRK